MILFGRMEATREASDFCLLIRLVLDGATLISAGPILNQLPVDSRIGRVSSGIALLLRSLSVEVVIVLTHVGACARQVMSLDLGKLLLFPCDNVLLGVHLISNVLGVLERLDVLFVGVRLLRQVLVQGVLDR